jgi:hypothetical protein
LLEGRVTIGPVCPVEPQPGERNAESCAAARKSHASRRVLVFTPDRDLLVASSAVDSTGSYRLALKPGVYLVDVERTGIEVSKTSPRLVRIEEGATVRLDINIDTGIR